MGSGVTDRGLDWVGSVAGAVRGGEIPRKGVDQLVSGVVFYHCGCRERVECKCQHWWSDMRGLTGAVVCVACAMDGRRGTVEEL